MDKVLMKGKFHVSDMSPSIWVAKAGIMQPHTLCVSVCMLVCLCVTQQPKYQRPIMDTYSLFY